MTLIIICRQTGKKHLAFQKIHLFCFLSLLLFSLFFQNYTVLIITFVVVPLIYAPDARTNIVYSTTNCVLSIFFLANTLLHLYCLRVSLSLLVRRLSVLSFVVVTKVLFCLEVLYVVIILYSRSVVCVAVRFNLIQYESIGQVLPEIVDQLGRCARTICQF